MTKQFRIEFDFLLFSTTHKYTDTILRVTVSAMHREMRLLFPCAHIFCCLKNVRVFCRCFNRLWLDPFQIEVFDLDPLLQANRTDPALQRKRLWEFRAHTLNESDNSNMKSLSLVIFKGKKSNLFHYTIYKKTKATQFIFHLHAFCSFVDLNFPLLSIFYMFYCFIANTLKTDYFLMMA